MMKRNDKKIKEVDEILEKKDKQIVEVEEAVIELKNRADESSKDVDMLHDERILLLKKVDYDSIWIGKYKNFRLGRNAQRKCEYNAIIR